MRSLMPFLTSAVVVPIGWRAVAAVTAAASLFATEMRGNVTLFRALPAVTSAFLVYAQNSILCRNQQPRLSTYNTRIER